MNRSFRTSFGLCAAALFAACAGDAPTPDTDFAGVDTDAPVTFIGKADGSDVSVDYGYRYHRVALGGDAAKELWGILESARGFTAHSRGGLDYLYGYYTVCATNGSAAACHIYSRSVDVGGDFAATIHGPRFASAASELFGAIANHAGVAPASVSTVESGRFICAKDNGVWCGVRPATAENPTLSLALVGLGDLGPDYVYEGWLITPEGPVTSGRFSLSADDETVEMEIDADLAAASSTFVLTIEPAVGDDPAPAATHVLAGDFSDGVADLSAAHPAAFGTDFSDAEGAYFLATPTTAADMTDNDQGVWFLDLDAGPGASLKLPTLPSGWAYEGWVVGENGPVSTGTFLDPAGPDSDGAGPAAGPDAAPPFPGQDFIDPAMRLVGGAIVISVEPVPDNARAPFFIKPLVDGDVTATDPGVLQSMANMAAETVPQGVAAFSR